MLSTSSGLQPADLSTIRHQLKEGPKAAITGRMPELQTPTQLSPGCAAEVFLKKVRVRIAIAKEVLSKWERYDRILKKIPKNQPKPNPLPALCSHFSQPTLDIEHMWQCPVFAAAHAQHRPPHVQCYNEWIQPAQRPSTTITNLWNFACAYKDHLIT